ncbi:MAG TPA: hypothetical protein VGG29_17700 [Caulobacteraceae bacterium]|jgi:hypothetical protein
MATKYDAVRLWLTQVRGDRVRVSFAEIESILGFRLPASARALPQWWVNTRGSHVQAAAWMDAGWRACQVDVAGEQVSFERIGRQRAGAAGSEQAGVSESGAVFRLDEAIVIDPAALRGGAIRMLEDYRDAHGGSLADAAIGLLNAMVLERRRQLVEWFGANAPKLPGDSTELIREDRDAR